MSNEEFYNKVKEMRKLQKEYFSTRNYTVLLKSKQVEAEIDREIKRIEETKQPNLFGI